MMSNPVVFGLDISPVGSFVLVDVFGVAVGMVFTTTPPPPPPLDDGALFNFPNSADVAKSLPPPAKIERVRKQTRSNQHFFFKLTGHFDFVWIFIVIEI